MRALSCCARACARLDDSLTSHADAFLLQNKSRREAQTRGHPRGRVLVRGMHQPFHHARGSHHDERTHLHQNPRAQNAVPPADQETEEEEEMHAPVQDGRGEHRRGVHVHRGVAVWDAASVFNRQWACTLYSCCKMMLMLIVNIFFI